MTKERKQYSREFKQEAVRLLETSGKSASELERELGIGKGNLWRWKRKFAADGKNAFPGHGRLTPEQERLRQLERERDRAPGARHPKKSSGHLLAPKQMRFQFIDDHRDEFPVRRMCKVLEVSPSGYYAWRGRPPSKREMANRELTDKMRDAFDSSLDK